MNPLRRITTFAPAVAFALGLVANANAGGPACGPGTITKTVVVTNSFGPFTPPWRNEHLLLPQFNGALGTLIKAEVKATANIVADVAAENTSTLGGCDWSWSLDSAIEVGFPAAVAPNLALLAETDGAHSFQTFDNTIDFGGPSGHTFPTVSGQDEGSAVITDATALQNVFTGAGSVDFLHSAIDDSDHSGCGNLVALFANTSKLTIQIIYTYCTEDVPDECNERHRRNCGSLLLYPEFDNRPGIVTLYTITDACCEESTGNKRVEFRFINRTNCLKTDQSFTLTPCDTITFFTGVVNSGGPNARGYGYAYVKSATNTAANPTGEPIVANEMIGHMLILNGITSVNYGMNAVSFKGIGADGAPNDDDQDGIRDLNGPNDPLPEYEEAPDEILIPRFLAVDDAATPEGGPPVVDSEIILINLSGGVAFTTIVDILGFNDNEEPLSAFYSFRCWDKPKLRTFASFTTNSFLKTTLHDADEIVGLPSRESGWLRLNGLVANSSGPEAIVDPAIYAVLVEGVGAYNVADLPFELCSQVNGDLLPTSIFGDGPIPVAGDNQ